MSGRLDRGLQRRIQPVSENPLPVPARMRRPGGVQAPVDLHYLPGARVGPRAHVASGSVARSSQARGLRLRDLAHPASAAPAVGREVRVPPGIVSGQQRPAPGGVLVAVLAARAQLIEQIRMAALGALDALPLPGRTGGAHVGSEDRLQPAWAAQLRLDRLPGLRIDDLLPPPPAGLLEDGRQLPGERPQGASALQVAGQGLVDVAQDVQLRGLGHGERERVLGAPDVQV